MQVGIDQYAACSSSKSGMSKIFESLTKSKPFGTAIFVEIDFIVAILYCA